MGGCQNLVKQFRPNLDRNKPGLRPVGDILSIFQMAGLPKYCTTEYQPNIAIGGIDFSGGYGDIWSIFIEAIFSLYATFFLSLSPARSSQHHALSPSPSPTLLPLPSPSPLPLPSSPSLARHPHAIALAAIAIALFIARHPCCRLHPSHHMALVKYFLGLRLRD
jgi:hypothetical protein